MHRRSPGSDTLFVVHHLAAWGLTPEGEVVGLLAGFDPFAGPNQGLTAKLMGPPPLNGRYMHRDELTQQMFGALKYYREQSVVEPDAPQ